MAKIVQTSSQKRVPLAELLPLHQPFAIHIFPSYYCNFKCFYCIHSLGDEGFASLGHKKSLMSFDTLKNAVDSCAQFGNKLKVMSFAGHGEPLVNRELPRMISYARDKAVADRLELVTNGYLLDSETSLALVSAGLNNLRVSIQGLSSAKYRDVAGAEVDFEKLVRQLDFFYRNKGNCDVYIKVVDSALEKGEDERFYEIFGKVSDRIAIEHVVPTNQGVDYSRLGRDFDKTQQGYEHHRVSVCPMPFYVVIIGPEGDVRTCCGTKFPVLIGNVNKESLPDLWRSKRLRTFQKMLLTGGRFKHPVCQTCTSPDYGGQPGDSLDEHAEEILKKIQDIEN
ncbi:MAG: hypothetical protein A2X49_00555 [Lentisphaerae bacterium GWF2_52_8]|nr:MAG: hypothetical protein A2X49_00555 [Lentisphaerae bacterium GWF2_52_8]